MRLSKQLLICIAGIMMIGSGSSYALHLDFNDSFWSINGNSGSDYWAVIGDAGNEADTRYDSTGYGSVGYDYAIAKYELTTQQYVAFLNDVAVSGGSLYNVNMSNSPYYKGVIRTGTSGNFSYSVRDGWENKPVVYVGFKDALRFINWLNTGNTEEGAYKFVDGVLQASYDGEGGPFRNPLAVYWLPSEDEWYKAAFYKGDGTDAGYWDYPTGSDTAPESQTPPGGDNSANYDNSPPYTYTDVGAYINSISPYGTYDQSGNVWEMTETTMYDGNYIFVRGGSFQTQNTTYLSASYHNLTTPENNVTGLRVASSYPFYPKDEVDTEVDAIPEPVTAGLLATGLIGIAIRIRKKP
ncbi:MAG: SUMF1/EgtB/PvdO family nonheme iron enzyme [Candidatus Auribacterota bacterium]|jgi:formylglycine-generating enzyme required for sulfatase activity|nr:SUMF1/EgtB/PvdO family nonheme iron enzyme [Candidatus Auribacterota bacterium]